MTTTVISTPFSTVYWQPWRCLIVWQSWYFTCPSNGIVLMEHRNIRLVRWNRTLSSARIHCGPKPEDMRLVLVLLICWLPVLLVFDTLQEGPVGNLTERSCLAVRLTCFGLVHRRCRRDGRCGNSMLTHFSFHAKLILSWCFDGGGICSCSTFTITEPPPRH